MKYTTEIRESGTVIDEFETFEEALKAVEAYEAEDREICAENGMEFTNDFYCIRNTETDEIVH